MEYTVQKLSRLAGVSTRTLRYYDEIGILKPARINSSGYRIYGQQEIDRLQQILFYRQMEVSLEQIKELVTSSTYDGTQALRDHRNQLLAKRKQLDRLIVNLEHTIAASEGKMIMSNKEKFEGFKKKMVEDNETQYGQEIRSKYGEDVVEQSNQKVLNLTQDEHDAVTKLADQLAVTLTEAIKIGNPTGELAQQAAELHKQWLTYYWSSYSKEAHAGVAQMYVDDERFTAYYDKIQPGAAVFLRDAIVHFTRG
jgi:DNA-binding transcriptional MerR regulator